MGINLKPLVKSDNISLDDLAHKTVAIDAFNILHQFLSAIRQRDGTPLKDAQGRVTSHLTGLLTRTAHLVERSIKPVYVFDGVPHPLKLTVLDNRHEIKQKARDAWQLALQQGDLENARKHAQQTSSLNEELVGEAQALLNALGIPYIEAPGEGEAQASYRNLKGDVDFTGSQDFDCLLFGAPALVRNVAATGRRKVPSKQKWIPVSPELINLKDMLVAHNISREQLVDIAILMGTDFNRGIKGIGPKTALKMAKEHGRIEDIILAENLDCINQLDEIRGLFLDPSVTDDYQLIWQPADENDVMRLLRDEHQFREDRVQIALNKFKKFTDRMGQKELFDF